MKAETVEAASGAATLVKTGVPVSVSGALFFGLSVPDLIQALTLALLVWQVVGIVWRGVPQWWGALGDALRAAIDFAQRIKREQHDDNRPK